MAHPAIANSALYTEGKLLGFYAVPTGVQDSVILPKGYRTQVIAAWGEPITGSMPAFSPSASGADQAMQTGMHHDGMHFLPNDGSSADDLLVINHEYAEPRFLHAAYAGRQIAGDDVVVDKGGATLITYSRRLTLTAFW
jgi:secreted PhoX family phosphatase